MSAMAERLKKRYFGSQKHPYQVFEEAVSSALNPEHTLLDAGCGRTAPVLRKYRGQAARLIGVDAVDFTEPLGGIELYKGDMSCTGLPDQCVDVIMSRSVMEHIDSPRAVYGEFFRLLKPGGQVLFLTANFWDYASLIAAAVPNSLHPWIVARTEGREEADVFPVRYRSNTKRAIYRSARQARLTVEEFHYLGQYPAYFMFNGPLFMLGTLYEKTIERIPQLHWLRGWILCRLRKPAN